MSKFKSFIKAFGLCLALYYVYNVIKVRKALERRRKMVDSYRNHVFKPVKQTVSEEQFQQALITLKQKVKNENEGLFSLAGPVSREILRGSCSFIGGGAAATLQLAHPYVATGVGDHSTVLKNPLARFQRTFFYVFKIAFGDLKECIEAAQTVRRIHNRITGKIEETAGPFSKNHTYAAEDLEALKWVHSTLFETSLFIYELMFEPLTSQQKESHMAYLRQAGIPFGLTPDVFPETYEEFQEYYFSVIHSDTLTVTEYGKKIADATLEPILWDRYLPINTLKVLTSELLPGDIPEKFGIKNSKGEHIYSVLLLAFFRSVYTLLPPTMRDLTAFAQREARIEGRDLPATSKFAAAAGNAFVNFSLKARIKN